MKWNKLTIETTTAAEDMLSYELQEMGIEGVEVEDHVPLSEEDRKIMYVDLLPDEIAPDDGTARVSCYIDEKEDLDAMVKKIQDKIEELSAFMPMGTGKITCGCTCRIKSAPYNPISLPRKMPYSFRSLNFSPIRDSFSGSS